jgi:diguanylate cyclase (GGDEF)-like protein
MWEVFPEHVALLDRDGVIVSVNRAWRQFGLQRGSSATAGVGANYLHVCERAASEGEQDAAEAADIIRAALAGTDSRRRLSYLCGFADEELCFSMRAVPVPGRYSGALIVHTDITAERRREQAWQYETLHDALTGLPNRALLTDRLKHAVAGANRGSRSVAVLFVDLDDFTSINNRYGQAAGDRVLTECARRMARNVRAADTIGRWGDDEFVVIAEGLNCSTTAADVAERLSSSLTERIRIAGASIRVQASVGMCYLEADRHPEQLIAAANADLQALRRHRAGHRNVV